MPPPCCIVSAPAFKASNMPSVESSTVPITKQLNKVTSRSVPAPARIRPPGKKRKPSSNAKYVPAQRACSDVSADAMALMRKYSWPGNVRQLENAVRRLGLTARSDQITRAEVESVLGSQPGTEPVLGLSDGDKLSASVARHLRRYFDLHGNMLPPPGLYGRILREVELPLIEIALDATGGNQAKCADLLGINRNTLRKKITDLDISVTRRRKLM